jgi:hypothetical protein
MPDQEKTVRVQLRRSLQFRSPTGELSAAYGPGVVDLPEHYAASLGGGLEQAKARAAAADAASKPKEGAQAGAGESKEQEPGDRFADMTKDELVSEAELRKLEVKRTDGGGGQPRKEDYLSALRQAEASKQGGGQS